MSKGLKLYKGDVFYFTESPMESVRPYHFYEDGALVVKDGKVKKAGRYEGIRAEFPDAELIDYTGRLIMPGFIDTHIHFPQSEMIGMFGQQLNEWLNRYTFPMEQLYASPAYADRMAVQFVQELFRNGTTTCVAYASVHPHAVESLFKVAEQYKMCMLTGKVLMNRNVPEVLQDTTEEGEIETCRLIEQWHQKGRNRYVITPRFAITSTPDQLRSAGRIYQAYPEVYMQTHISENKEEVKTVLELFPDCQDYLEIYEKAGIIGERTILGHGVHLSDSELERMASAGAMLSHCPTSNSFLGSGLFSMERANRLGTINVIATDVAGGTSFSMFKTMAEAYKVQQLGGYVLSPLEAFYKTTLGAAKALHLSDQIGSLLPGMIADFIVIDYSVTQEQTMRSNYLQRINDWTLENRLFGLEILGDDRNIQATYLMGECVYNR